MLLLRRLNRLLGPASRQFLIEGRTPRIVERQRPVASCLATLQCQQLAAASGWQRRCLAAAAVAAQSGSSGRRLTHAKASAAEDAALEGTLEDVDDDELGEEAEEDVGAEIHTAGADWGEKALDVVQQLLGSDSEELQDIELFSFRAIPPSKRLDIRLDKTTDQYGSPSLEDVANFSRLFTAAFEAAIGEEAAGEIEVEVSSPGAERQVRLPGELQRFAELPMKVEYVVGEQVDTRVLSFQELDAEASVSRWRIADVRANRSGGKGRGLTAKQRKEVFEIPLDSLRRVNLHIDI